MVYFEGRAILVNGGDYVTTWLIFLFVSLDDTFA